MRVLLLTNHYGRMPGGAVAMTEATHRLLDRAGHEVVPFAIKDEYAHPSEWQDYWPTPDELRSKILPLSDHLETPYSFVARRKLGMLVDAAAPDVAHLHNPYGKLTLSVVDALRERGVPIVMTLHEYRSICPNGWLATHDGICHRCVGSTTLHAVRHRCVDGSVVRSGIAAAEAAINRRRNQFRKIEVMIAPSRFLQAQVVAGGLDPSPIRIVPNPADRLPTIERRPSAPARFVFSGRLVEGKGIDVLLNAAKLLEGKAEVVLFGAGSLGPHIRERIERERLQVSFRGYCDKETMARELDACTASVLPALWYENAPMTILEAGGRGVATIASDLGGMPEMIEDGKTGVLVPPGDAFGLADAMRALADDPDRALQLGRAAWQRVGERHDPDAHTAAVITCYEEAIRSVHDSARETV